MSEEQKLADWRQGREQITIAEGGEARRPANSQLLAN
jgi:hypothetical protein